REGARAERFAVTIVLAFAMPAILGASFAGGTAHATPVTVAGITFDTDDATTTASLVSGGYATAHGSGLWSGSTRDFPVASSVGTFFQRPTYQSGYDPSVPVFGGAGSSVTLGHDPKIAGITNPRDTIQLTWGGMEVSNGAGDDLVIFEQATSEAFAIRVHDTGTGDWTGWFYQVFEPVFDAAADATPTLFDLSDLGLGVGAAIDAIEVTNLTEADRVDTEISGTGLGYGFVDFGGGAGGFAPARWSLSSGTYKSFEPGKYDPDIQYVAALRSVGEPNTDPIPAPAPPVTSIFAAAVLGLALMRRRAR
ncbi:MAG: hypothetical protein ACTSRY_01385, partial [Alphaproteobacteria bacterium]